MFLVAEDYGHDLAAGKLHLRRQTLMRYLRKLQDTLAPPRLFVHELQRPLDCRGKMWRRSSAVDERPRFTDHVIDDLSRCAKERTEHAERLAAGVQADPMRLAQFFAKAAPGRAKHTRRVRFVDDKRCLVPPRDIAQRS